jgi:hypothetical protein
MSEVQQHDHPQRGDTRTATTPPTRDRGHHMTCRRSRPDAWRGESGLRVGARSARLLGLTDLLLAAFLFKVKE